MRRIVPAIILIFLIALPLSADGVEKYTLDSLIAAMETGNAELLKSDEEIAKAHLDTADAKGAYTPTIDLLISGTYMANPTIGPIKVNPGDIKWLPDVVSSIWTDPIDVSMNMGNNMIQGQLTLTQPIFTWGKITNAVKLYNKILEIRQTEKDDKIDSLSVELEGSLGGLYYARAILEQLRLAAEDAHSLIEIAKSGYENGVMLLDDYNVARLSKSELDMAMTEVEVQISSLMEFSGTL